MLDGVEKEIEGVNLDGWVGIWVFELTTGANGIAVD